MENSETQRLFVGGLSDDITAEDLKNRFKSLVNVSKVDMIVSQRDNKPKGFAYINAECTDQQLKKCMKMYNGTNWRGSTLSIQLAKASFIDKLKKEKENASLQLQNKKKWMPVDHEKDMSVITVKNCKKRKFWKRLPTGKLVRMMRVRFPGSKTVTVVDPGKHINNFKRFTHKDLIANIQDSVTAQKPSFLIPKSSLDKEQPEDREDPDGVLDEFGVEHEGDNNISVQVEKEAAYSILSELFGGDIKKENIERVPTEETTDEEDSESESLKEIIEEKEEEEYVEEPVNPSETEKENARMKSLFFGEKEVKSSSLVDADKGHSSFSFSFLPEEEEEELVSVEEEPVVQPNIITKPVDIFTEEIRKSSETPFLFIYTPSQDSNRILDLSRKRNLPTPEETREFWDKIKGELTEVYKKQRKNSLRLSRKFDYSKRLRK